MAPQDNLLLTARMVRLITHNLLACHAKGCNTNNFPLKLQDVVVEVREAEFNADFLRGFLPRIEWTALVNAAKEVCKNFVRLRSCFSDYEHGIQLGDTSLPSEMPEMVDDEFLKNLHHVLLEVTQIKSTTHRSQHELTLCLDTC